MAALHRIWPPLLTGIIICQIGLDWGERTEPGYAPNILFPFFSRLIRPSLKLIKEVQTKLLNPSEKLSFPEKSFLWTCLLGVASNLTISCHLHSLKIQTSWQKNYDPKYIFKGREHRVQSSDRQYF